MTDIGVTFTIHGSFNIDPRGDSQGDVETTLTLGSGQFNASIMSGPNSYTPTVRLGAISNWVSYTVSPSDPGDLQFNGVYALTGAETDLSVLERLYAGCGIGTACSFEHTAALTFSLPQNVTYTSDSGVFLTAEEIQSVPEPGSMILIATGLGALGLVRQRRRSASL